ncbi:MAG: hypothetical protein IT370_01055 [Deltaproteobacteria bacterium]|nr:hypothetical protein [Deltaproteobacteria bacterium]
MGCPSDPPSGDGDAGTDGGAGVRGLVFVFQVQPVLPGQTSPGVTVDSLELHLREVRVVGDAAAGDPRVSRADLTMKFLADKSTGELAFPDAPSGMYSRLAARLGGTGDSYVIKGRALANGVSRPFEIEDEEALPLAIDFTPVQVRAGRVTTVRIGVDVAAAIADVDWDTVRFDGEKLKLEHDDAGIRVVRSALVAAIRFLAIE